jgi:nitroreductase
VETYLAIASRRDERRTTRDAIPGDAVRRVLDAGRLSGSSRNSQPWTFVVAESDAAVERLAPVVNVPDNVRSAGLVVAIVLAPRGASFDAGRAAQSMLLAAWNEGLSSSPNGIRDLDAARDALGCSEDETPVIVLSIGVPERRRDPDRLSPEEWSARANRKPLDEVVRRIS